MRVWIPFHTDSATLSLNALSGEYRHITANSCYLHHIKAFHRKKDAVTYMEKLNSETDHPSEYKIVCFESK